jgi:thymidylate kinase
VSLVMEVLLRLDDRGVAYCHWKSNDHLDAALSADTDLDILVDPAGIDDVYSVFAELACRRGRVANARNDVGLEDFLGVDDESGRMVHFHVHYRIPGGERHNKRFRLPWERTVLETRVRGDSGVWVTAPDVEVVLLLTRYALKLRGRDIARRAHGPDAELAFLMARTGRDAVLATTGRLLGDRAVPVVADLLEHGPSTGALYRLRRVVLRALGSQTSSRGPAAFTRRMNREAAWAMRGISRKVAPRPVLKGRGGTGGGLLVAFVGCDGSGKSTMVGETRAFLAPKLDVYPMYLGSGDGSSSLARKPMKVVRDIVFGPSRNKGTIAKKAEAGAAHPGAMSAAKAIWAVTLAAEKHRKLRQVMKARTRGMVVICDRWPQMQFAGELDGPRLTHWADGSVWQRRLAAYELRPYELARRFPPDLVIRLDVDLDTASLRRPEDGRDYLEHRIGLVRALTFDGSLFGAVDIDASQPPDKVLTAILRAIWSRL